MYAYGTTRVVAVASGPVVLRALSDAWFVTTEPMAVAGLTFAVTVMLFVPPAATLPVWKVTVRVAEL
jgi:hypothetical protein